jgi:hypothetical protein
MNTAPANYWDTQTSAWREKSLFTIGVKEENVQAVSCCKWADLPKETQERLASIVEEEVAKHLPSLVEYLDWSDQGLEKYEGGHGGSYGNLDFAMDDEPGGDLFLYLRRDTKKKRDFTLIVPTHLAEKLYELLGEKFGKND